MPLKTTPRKQARNGKGKLPMPLTPSSSRTVSDAFGSNSSSHIAPSSSSSVMIEENGSGKQIDYEICLEDPSAGSVEPSSNIGFVHPSDLHSKRPVEEPTIGEPSSKRHRKPSQKARGVYINTANN